MNRAGSMGATTQKRVPRASGDEPDAAGNVRSIEDVFPARVGMNRDIPKLVSNCSSVPRASGDEPHRLAVGVAGVACSPREWG